MPGVRVGHYTDLEHATGCTVVLTESSAVGGIDVRGAAPGSRETEILHPLTSAELITGCLLTGGSVWGLAAVDGATRYLTERGIGVKFANRTIPLLPAAVIFDLGLKSDVCPDADAGYAACESAFEPALESASGEVPQGSVGAGTGATVGGMCGLRRRIKGGLGMASVSFDGPGDVPGDDAVVVGAIVVVNAVGGVVDPDTGEIVAGPRRSRVNGGFEDSNRILLDNPPESRVSGWEQQPHTVIGAIATNARMNKKAAIRLAGAGQDAIAMAIRPAHTESDGDIVFTLATGHHEPVHPDRLRAAATRAMVGAILSAIGHATGLGGIPSAAEYLRSPEA